MLRSIKPFALPALAAALALMTAQASAQASARVATQIALTESEAFAAHTVVGDVRAEVHQSSLFPKVSSRELADQQLREKALQMGADAVIGIKYENNNPMFSKKGFIATGKAVKYATAPAVTAAAVVAAPPPVVPAVAQPAPVIAAAPPAAGTAAAVPAAPAAAPAVAPAAAAGIQLTEQNIARAYAVLGPVNAELDPAALTLEKTGKQVLDDALRSQAARLGADAVILVKYTASASGKGPAAIGVAVKFN